MTGYYKELLFYVQRLTGDREKSKDVIQEAYKRIIETNSKTKIENHRAYLYRMAKNILIDESRKYKNFTKVDFQETDFCIPKEEQPDETFYRTKQYEELTKLVQKLPTRSRQAFTLHVIQGLSRKEIAQKMDINPNTVEKHITNAILKIQQELEEN